MGVKVVFKRSWVLQLGRGWVAPLGLSCGAPRAAAIGYGCMGQGV